MLKSIVITKWIEPYVVLETFKKDFECLDLTFDGFTKKEKQKEFYSRVEKSISKITIGLYLKNVNKFYVMTSDNDVDYKKTILDEKFDVLNSYSDEFTPDEAIEKVDMAKAEFIILQNK